MLEKMNHHNAYLFGAPNKENKALLYKKFRIQDLNITLCFAHTDEYDSSYQFPKHKDTWYELVYVVDGEYYTTISDHTVRVKNGDFTLIPPGTEHSHYKLPGKNCLAIAFAWNMELIADSTLEQNNILQQSKELYQILATSPAKAHADTQNLLGDLLTFGKESMQKHSMFELNLELSFLKILIKAANIIDNDHIKNKGGIDETFINRNIVQRAISYLETNYENDIQGKDVAAAVNLSYGYLCRLFKKYSDKTITGKLMEIRLTNALELIKTTDDTMRSIAFAVGFCSESYFINCFKKEYGMSPKQYKLEILHQK